MGSRCNKIALQLLFQYLYDFQIAIREFIPVPGPCTRATITQENPAISIDHIVVFFRPILVLETCMISIIILIDLFSMGHCEGAHAFEVTCHCEGARGLRLCIKKLALKLAEIALEPALECGASYFPPLFDSRLKATRILFL